MYADIRISNRNHSVRSRRGWDLRSFIFHIDQERDAKEAI